MSRIDYSKWDKIDCSSSDEDDEEESNLPRVTRLDTPSRITRTADGSLIVEEQQQQRQAPTATQAAVTAVTHHHQQATTTTNQNWTVNGSEVTTKDGLTLYWRQDRYSICLRLVLPSLGITGKDIRVHLRGVLPYADRYSAVGNDKVAAIRLCCKDQVLLEGEFPHPIHATEDADDDDNNDWEIDRVTTEKMNGGSEQQQQQVVMAYWIMTLQKATPMEGVVIWWRNPLKQFPEIEAREANPNSNKSQQQAFQQAWEEAHRQFREKRKNPKT